MGGISSFAYDRYFKATCVIVGYRWFTLTRQWLEQRPSLNTGFIGDGRISCHRNGYPEHRLHYWEWFQSEPLNLHDKTVPINPANLFIEWQLSKSQNKNWKNSWSMRCIFTYRLRLMLSRMRKRRGVSFYKPFRTISTVEPMLLWTTKGWLHWPLNTNTRDFQMLNKFCCRNTYWGFENLDCWYIVVSEINV